MFYVNIQNLIDKKTLFYVKNMQKEKRKKWFSIIFDRIEIVEVKIAAQEDNEYHSPNVHDSFYSYSLLCICLQGCFLKEVLNGVIILLIAGCLQVRDKAPCHQWYQPLGLATDMYCLVWLESRLSPTSTRWVRILWFQS